jgi:hypothetical protein
MLIVTNRISATFLKTTRNHWMQIGTLVSLSTIGKMFARLGRMNIRTRGTLATVGPKLAFSFDSRRRRRRKSRFRRLVVDALHAAAPFIAFKIDSQANLLHSAAVIDVNCPRTIASTHNS